MEKTKPQTDSSSSHAAGRMGALKIFRRFYVISSLHDIL